MEWRRTAAVALGLALLPGASAALDIDGGLRTSVEYDSNVFRVDGPDEQDDVVFRITPLVRVQEDEGKFQWFVDYRFPYEVAIETDRVDGFRHFLDAQAEYNLAERTRIFFVDRFTRSDGITNARSADSSDAPTVGTLRREVWRNRATLGVDHQFSPRTDGSLFFTHRFFDSDLPARSRTNVFVGAFDANRALSSRHSVGMGFTGTYQDFDESNDNSRPPRQALFLNLFASWLWAIDETTTVRLRGGPTYIRNERDAFAGEPSDTDAGWDFFAEGLLSRRWTPKQVSTLTYTRTDSTTSGLGSSVLDIVTLLHNWRIAERWSASMRFDFTQRDSTVDDADISRWGTRAEVSYRITRHLRAGVRYSFNKQDSTEDTAARLSDFDDHIVSFGLQYDFDQYSLDRYLPW